MFEPVLALKLKLIFLYSIDDDNDDNNILRPLLNWKIVFKILENKHNAIFKNILCNIDIINFNLYNYLIGYHVVIRDVLISHFKHFIYILL